MSGRTRKGETRRPRAARRPPAATRTRPASGGRGPKASNAAAERRRVVSELRALAHPLRLRLYELFAEKPRTTMQVAAILGEPATRLYHHVNALERSGLLRLRETRPNRGTVEKYFEAAHGAQKGTGVESLGESTAVRHAASAAMGAVLEQVRQDMLASLREPKRGETGLIMLRMILTASPAKAGRLRQRLLDLIREIKEECAEPPATRSGKAARRAGADAPREEEERWALTLAFAPSWPRRPGGTS